MDYRNYRAEIETITKSLLEEYAADEMDFVIPLTEKYLALIDDNGNPKLSNKMKDIPLGFSGDVNLLVTVLIPVVASTLSKLVEFLTIERFRDAQLKASNHKRLEKLLSFSLEAKIDKLYNEITITISNSGISRKKAKEISTKIVQAALLELKKNSSGKQ